MGLFSVGLVLFLGVHSLRVFAEGWRSGLQARMGDNMFKLFYSLASLLGLVLMVYGYGLVRWDSPMLWLPPVGTRHAAALLMLVSLVLLVAAYVPHNIFKQRLRHPMVLSVKVWALAHLLANGRVADMLLFGGFLVWSVLVFRASRQRDRLAALAQPADAPQSLIDPQAASQSTPEPMKPVANHNARVILIGVVVWTLLMFGGHKWLFGVSPLGM